MTRNDFNEGLVYLAARFPSFSAPDVTRDAWFDDLRRLPKPVYRRSVGIIARTLKAWYSTNNLAAMVFEVEAEARRQVRSIIEEKLGLPSWLTPTEAKELGPDGVKELLALTPGERRERVAMVTQMTGKLLTGAVEIGGEHERK